MGGSKPKVGVPDEDPKNVVERAVRKLTNLYPKFSACEILASMPRAERQAWLDQLSENELRYLEYDWKYYARPKQRTPTQLVDGKEWVRWVLTCGRGFGKTRAGAEWVRGQIESGKSPHIALIAANAHDLRHVIVEDVRGGGSGLMQICPPWNMPSYEPSKMRLSWDNPNYKSYGSSCSLISAEKPDALRGPAYSGAWLDEFCKWPRMKEAWDMLAFGMRIGKNPQYVITTTPKNSDIFKMILKMRGTVVTTGSTFENSANLSEGFLEEILANYEGSRLGRQELYAEVLEDIEGALWTLDMIEKAYLDLNAEIPMLRRRVVGVDPQMSFIPGSLTGIVVAGASAAFRGRPVQGFILADRSMSGSPKQWATAVVEAYHDYDCHAVIAERNQGGELVADNIHNVDPNVRVKLVTATKSKGERAIPVSTKYEQERIYHVKRFPELEDQMRSYVPGEETHNKKRSPNRLDAAVHALNHLLVAGLRSGAGIAIKKRI